MADSPTYDDDEAFCDGDPDPADIDWDQVVELEQRQQAVLALDEQQRPLAMLGLLSELHGDDLQVL